VTFTAVLAIFIGICFFGAIGVIAFALVDRRL
jgi:hypothetical protein